MKGDPVPDPDHVIRYVGSSNIDQGVINGAAFLCKASENSPSVNWIEVFDGGVESQIGEVRKRSRLQYGARACLARLNVGQVCSYVAEMTTEHLRISVIQDPLDAEEPWPEDPSHALMPGVPKRWTADDPHAEAIGDLIAQCVIDTFPAKA